MINLVIGAAASGKSEYAEDVVTALPGEKIYLATMEPFGPEAEEKIARHRALRAGKSFRTIERPMDFAGLIPEADWNLLIEDLPNLAANEIFSPKGGGAAAVFSGMEKLCETAASVTIVTGDIFSDGGAYDADTRAYMKVLADLHSHIAEKADIVVEVICGIPYAVKGELPVNTFQDETAKWKAVRQGSGNGYGSLKDIHGMEEKGYKTGTGYCSGENVKETVTQSRLHVYVTGPMASGKRDYVLRTLGIPEAEAAFEVQELLRENPDLDVAELAARISDFRAVTQTETGAGVIPLSAADRKWRERAGRLACLLAARADIVVRMVCGIPVTIRK